MLLLIPAQLSAQSARNEPIVPIPLSIDVNPVAVALGRQLFEDPRLARNGRMACAHCHQLAQGGDDGLARSVTNTGAPDVLNAPTVFNTAFNFRQTWRGKFRTLENQAQGDLHNPRHSNTDWAELLPKLRGIPEYRAAFADLYADAITAENVLHAIAEYERSLITPNSRFDQWLRGDDQAISTEERAGYYFFKNHGCTACHQGVNVGGNMFQKVGIFEDYFSGREPTQAEFGRFNVTGREEDRFVFKVPSLRNVAVTAPYFHDGSQATLEDAVRTMARIQLGTTLQPEELRAIVRFLSTLTGEYQGVSLESGLVPDVKVNP